MWFTFAAGSASAQTTTAQLAVTTDTTLNSTLVATGGTATDGTTYKPTIAATTELHRDALYITNGATLSLVSGADVWVKNDDSLTAFLRVGYGDNQTGTLTIASGAALAVGQSSRYANFQVAEGSGAVGTVNQSGGSVAVKGSLNIGVNGGSGTYNLTGGSLTLDHADDAGHTSLATIGFNNLGAGSTASSGLLNISGGTLTVTAHLWNGTDYGSTALILGNRKTNATTYGGGDGVINQTGGTVHVDNHAALYLSSVGNGTYNFTGGTLEIGGTSLQANYGSGGGTYAFNFAGASAAGGATLKVIGSGLNTSVNANLGSASGATVSTIDTNGFDSTWSGNLTAAGLHQVDFGGNALVKTGAGVLTFSGASRVLDTFSINGGSIRQTAGATSSVEYMVGSGSGNTGAQVMDGGTLTITTSTKTVAGITSTVTGSLRIGDFGGTGTFTQNAGTVTVGSGSTFHIGNQGGTGTYNLVGGTLDLIGNLNVLGRSTAGNPVSTGTLNLSGGAMQLSGTGSLILGNNIAAATAGTGTINQTGGTLTVANDSYLYLSAYGNGTYNLNGGTLAIGGSSLQGKYNSGSGSYAFNLGGGTLKVSGSNLTAAVNATLTASTQSTLDTAGYDATWSGNLTGTGGLIKTGTGTLTLSGSTRSFGFFNAAQGITAQTTGATTSGEFVVGSGSGANGTYNLSGGSLVIDGLPPFGGSSSSLRVGDFGGTGVFNQTGGTVTVGSATVGGSWNIGNQGGTGTYNLSGGTLTLAYGLSNLGRNVTGTTASSGTLNLSASGTLVVDSNASLILGDRDSAGLSGTGTLNQTGGTLRVNSGGALYLSAYGNGTYNLSGGTLEVGGSSLVARYAGAGTTAFNWGAGTIKVSGSNLTSAVNANLTGAATLNTNGFNAAWAGTLTGNGSLTKTGAGLLTLTGANTYTGGTVISAGTVKAGNSTGSAFGTGAVTIASGATLTGAGYFSGALQNNGTYAPGNSPALVTLSSFSQGSTGLLQLEIAGLDRGTGYDALDITGGAVFGGTLEVSFYGGFSAAGLTAGNTFNLFDWGSASGTFATLSLPSLAAYGLTWDTSALYTTGVLSVASVASAASAVPEPATYAASLGLAALGLAVWRRQRRRATAREKA